MMTDHEQRGADEEGALGIALHWNNVFGSKQQQEQHLQRSSLPEHGSSESAGGGRWRRTDIGADDGDDGLYLETSSCRSPVRGVRRQGGGAAASNMQAAETTMAAPWSAVFTRACWSGKQPVTGTGRSNRCMLLGLSILAVVSSG
jgi:hypothetical protein